MHYENKDADRFLAISENLKIDYVMASYNCYANFMSIFDMAKRMAGIDVFSLSHFLDILNFIIFLDLCQYDDTIFSGRQLHPSNTHIRRP